ncbi:MAG: hypothetical protein H7Z41_02200 [Cytophagales bacterium]|nr:hypothetical protein [Armatimonadota bacterium]
MLPERKDAVRDRSPIKAGPLAPSLRRSDTTPETDTDPLGWFEAARSPFANGICWTNSSTSPGASSSVCGCDGSGKSACGGKVAGNGERTRSTNEDR